MQEAGLGHYAERLGMLVTGQLTPKQLAEAHLTLLVEDYYLACLLSGETVSSASYSLSLLMSCAQPEAVERFNRLAGEGSHDQ
jgi:hypothetical protein